MNVRYHELARKEIIEATGHYGRVRAELGAEFLAEFATAIDAIQTNPALYAEIRPGIRCYLLSRFPYAIYYRMPDPGTVRMIAVRHHSRRPGVGIRRK